MDDQKRRDDGMAQRRKVLGNAWVDKSIANRNSFNTDSMDLITRYAWGEIWTRPHFDQRTRRVLVIGTMVALGQWDEFRLHVRAALTEGGFTPDDIKEILLQQAIYCGVPAANHAVKEAVSDCPGAGAAEGIDRRRLALRSAAAPRAGRSTSITIAVPSSISNSVACSRSAAVSPTCEAITMLAKLITLPIASAIASASSQPPALADRGAGDENQEDRKERDDGELAQRQQPREAHRGHRRQLQMIADEQRDRNVRPLIEAVDRRNHDLEGDDGPGRNEIGRQQRAVE